MALAGKRKGNRQRSAHARPAPGPFDSIEAFMALPDREKERLWKSFDNVRPSDTRPLTPEERKLWERARRKRGRPKTGNGVRVISLSVERGLLDRADSYARRNGMTRAALFSQGVRAILSNRNRRRAG